MSKKKEPELSQKLKEAFDSVFGQDGLPNYPKEAMPLGTIVRSHRIDTLGAITDAFYGEMDADGQKIIIYTILLFPKSNAFSGDLKKKDQYYVTNEYEYEVTGYLMMPPINLTKLASNLGGGLFI
tara:strand:+ start:122 stop:496 length:375 start_codon:yes stop_codon:yes gene_type:complete